MIIYIGKCLFYEKATNYHIARNLTPLGRNTVLKSLIIPKLNHLFSVLPDPPEETLQSFQKKIFRFLWGNKPDKVKRTQITCTIKDGGIKCPKIKEIIEILS